MPHLQGWVPGCGSLRVARGECRTEKGTGLRRSRRGVICNAVGGDGRRDCFLFVRDHRRGEGVREVLAPVLQGLHRQVDTVGWRVSWGGPGVDAVRSWPALKRFVAPAPDTYVSVAVGWRKGPPPCLFPSAALSCNSVFACGVVFSKRTKMS